MKTVIKLNSFLKEAYRKAPFSRDRQWIVKIAEKLQYYEKAEACFECIEWGFQELVKEMLDER